MKMWQKGGFRRVSGGAVLLAMGLFFFLQGASVLQGPAYASSTPIQAQPTIGLPVMPLLVPASTVAPPWSGQGYAEEGIPADVVTIEENETPLGLATQEEGVLSVLLIGVDSHEKDNYGRSDTMILAQINTATGETRMVSFLRDLLVKIPGHGTTRLNAAYFYGGAALLQQTLENNFGVRADSVVTVDFQALIQLVDRMGGVPVAVSEKERVALNKFLKEYNQDFGFPKEDGLLAEAGEQRLTGKQALSFCRIRKMDSDFMRTGRQRRVLEGIVTQMRSMSTPQMLQWVMQNFDAVETDLTLKDIMALLPLLQGEKEMKLSSMQVPLDNAFHDDVVAGMQVLVPNLKKNSQAVKAFLSGE